MVQRDALVRHGLASPGQRDAVGVVGPQLADVAAVVLEVEGVHAAAGEVGGLDEALDDRVVVVDAFVFRRVVEAAPEVGADAAGWGLVGQVARGVHDPVEGDGADGGVRVEGLEEGDEGFWGARVGAGGGARRVLAGHG